MFSRYRQFGAPEVMDYLNYSVSGPDRSFGSFPDAQPRERHELYFATAGATNSDALPLPPIKINEWMAANSIGILNPINGDRDDWFELYNPSTDVVDLSGFTLTDDLLNPFQYTIPTNVFIAPHGFVLVWAEGNSRRPDTNGGLHVDFKLSASGESIALFCSTGTVMASRAPRRTAGHGVLISPEVIADIRKLVEEHRRTVVPVENQLEKLIKP